MATEHNEPFALSRADRESALWSRLKAHIQNRLTILRLENDHPMPEAERHQRIGQIAELKRFEALDAEPVTAPGRHWRE